MADLKITQVKSTNRAQASQVATIAALGLHKIGQSVIMKDSEAVRGMVHKVAHLVTCEEV